MPSGATNFDAFFLRRTMTDTPQSNSTEQKGTLPISCTLVSWGLFGDKMHSPKEKVFHRQKSHFQDHCLNSLSANDIGFVACPCCRAEIEREPDYGRRDQ